MKKDAMTLADPQILVDGCVTLRADGVEVVVDVTHSYPVILHWGRALGAAPGSIRLIADGGVPHSDLDEVTDPGLLREGARGFTGRPALRGHRSGQDFSPLFEIVDLLVDENRLTVLSVDALASLEVTCRLELTDQGVLLVDYSIRNTGVGTYSLDELSVWLPVPDRATETLDFSGRWLRERQPQRLAFAPGLRVREGREGRSGHDYTIVQCALTENTTTESGEAWGLSLLWSGGSRHLAERDAMGRAALGAGELLEPGEVELAPGARYCAPTVAAFFSDAGLDGLGDRAHRWLRARPEHPGTPRPLTLNVWEAVYFDHDFPTLSRLADRAAEIGVERFVLDDGWFGSRRDDWSGLGDWQVSPEVWPDGLRPLADKVHALGMQFGLWFEGEMVNPDSDLYREHPDWILQVPGRTPPLARHQLVLDLVNPAAYSYVLESVHSVVSENGVDYIKWDHNRFLTDAGHHGSPAARQQTLAIYRLFDELKARTPGLEIESCASGGGRIDLGMAFHADRFWTSDQNDALERQQIQRWTSLVIPPEMLGTHVGPTQSHSSGRVHNIQMRTITALFGHAGIEWNLLEAAPHELEALAEWTAFYRRHRGLLHSGKVVRVDHVDDSAQVQGVVAQDRSEAIFSYVQLTTPPAIRPASFRVPGLDPEGLYRVRVEEFGGAHAVQRRAPHWTAGVVTSGAALAEVGLRPPVLWPEQAILIVAVRVDESSRDDRVDVVRA